MKTIEKQKLQQFVNKLAEINRAKDEAFEFLQDRNGDVNGNRWCCAETNYKELLNAGYDYSYKFEIYNECEGKIRLMEELMSTLAELNFWK